MAPLFEAESASGEVTIIAAEAGETPAMTADRAWAMARALAWGGEGTRDFAETAAACRAWVWARHVGCEYPVGSEIRALLDRLSSSFDAGGRGGR